MNSKRSATSSPGKSALLVLVRESWWFALIASLVYLAVVLYTYDAGDPGWSHNSTVGNVINNAGGRFGAWLADILLYLFGLSAWWWLAFGLTVVYWGYRRMEGQVGQHPLFIAGAGFLVLIVASSSLEGLRMVHLKSQLPYQPGGMLGAVISGWTRDSFGNTGATLLLLLAWCLGFSWFIGRSWLGIAEAIGATLEQAVLFVHSTWQQWEDRRAGQVAQTQREEHVAVEKKRIEEHEPVRIEPAVFEIPKSERVAAEKQVPLFADLPTTPIPPLSLLDEPKANQETVSPETIEFTSRLIERKLGEFGVKITVVAAYPGPVITRYEVEPSVGVKGSQIVNLAKDLARALSMVSIRVVETIPGKNYMGLELPNQNRQTVFLGEILSSTAYNDPPSPLTLAMGKDIAGKPVVANLAKMPHLLVAGTTGAGKSVAINAMILSLLYKATAREVRLILVDPKMLELSVYDDIPHLLAPVVTDMKHAANALNWCVQEMERRYRLMSALGVRNLSGYNQKVTDAVKSGKPLTNPHTLTPDSPEPLDELPFLVVVIDELADLMMVAGKKIEELIARLAQKARAAGIHLILATQRPSVDVITGLIKANIPTRVAFQVSSKIDSRTILDQMGAESLLGQGDMLYLPPGTGYPQRVHGAFVSDDEVHRIVEYIKTTGAPDYIEGILDGSSDSDEADSAGNSNGGGNTDAEADPLYDEAVNIVLKNRRASISLVQRHLRIGYNRAARLIEQMETAGLVSSMQSNGNREVLAPSREE